MINVSVADRSRDAVVDTLNLALDHQIHLTRERDALNEELAELAPIIGALREAQHSIELADALDLSSGLATADLIEGDFDD